MALLTISLYEFQQFLQILMWIAIPLVVVSIIITVIIHRWRKRRNDREETIYPQNIDNLVMPQVGEISAEIEPSYQGMLWMRSKYQQDIAIADEKHEKLLVQNKALEQKCLDLLAAVKESQPLVEKTVDAGLQNKLEEYEQEIQRLEAMVIKKEQQVESLQNQRPKINPERIEPSVLLPLPASEVPTDNNKIGDTIENSADYDALKQHLAWTEQEKESLKKEIVEQGVLRDMLDEKSSQVIFLQNQLEERIKGFHEAEIRSKEDMSRVNELQYTVFNIRKENQQQLEDNRIKTTLIEKMGKELQAVQELSSAHIALLNEKLTHEIEQVKDLEAKLSFSHRLLQKIQDEIGTSFEKQMILYTNEAMSSRDEHTKTHPKISAWIESPSEEEEFEHII